MDSHLDISAMREGDPAGQGTAAAALSSVIALMLTVALLALVMTTPVQARQGMAAIAVDARTGRVLFARHADAPRIPASITKVMTVYMIFAELKAGRLSLNTRIRFSRHAASRPPSKLGLRPGQTITVDQAIRALVTKSANDVAAAVAEHIAGTESAFARRMTQVARRMGMTRTTFRNASGLPTPPNVTTARDLATLSLRIQRDFPRLYKRYFALRTFRFRGRVYRNHNRLLGRVPGVDGLKTGYTRAAGYNLAATIRRNGKRVVAVVLGMPSGRARNAYMRRLLERMIARRDLARGTHIAALAGSPPGLSRARMLALARSRGPVIYGRPDPARTRVARSSAAKTRGSKTVRTAAANAVPRPAARPQALADRSERHGRTTSKADGQPAVAPVRPRPRPAIVALMARNMRMLAMADARPEAQPEAPKAEDTKPAPTSARAETAAAPAEKAGATPAADERRPAEAPGRTFVAVRPQPAPASAPQGRDLEKSSAPQARSVAKNGRRDEGVPGRVAMEVRPAPAPVDAADGEGEKTADIAAVHEGERPLGPVMPSGMKPQADDTAAEAHAGPAARGKEPPRTRLALAAPLAFAPVPTARVVRVDPERREMVVARTPVPAAEQAKEAKTGPETPAPAGAAREAAAAADDLKAEVRAEGETADKAMAEKDRKAERKQETDPRLARYRRSWNIQLGAFPAEEGAKGRLKEARRAARRLLAGKPGYTMRFERRGRTYYRARFAGFDRRTATRACRALKRHRIPCFAIAPGAGDT